MGLVELLEPYHGLQPWIRRVQLLEIERRQSMVSISTLVFH